MALYSTLTLKAEAILSSALDLSTARDRLIAEVVVPLSTGTGADAADLLFHDRRTLTASQTENLDLTGGSLTSPLGAALVFARVKFLMVYAAAGNTNNVILGNATANPWTGPLGGTTPTFTVRPDGFFSVCAPDATAYAVTTDSADILKVANSSSGTSVTYDIVIIGASA